MISFCQMTQNRLPETKECIERCLPYVDKVVIVDGGSIDDTIFYMRNWAEREPKLEFYIYPWKDDFSAQRNNYLQHVPVNTWALVSDPDEVFEDSTLENLSSLAVEAEAKNKNMIGFQCRSVSLKGSERVWENLDNYWKRLLFKKYENTHYVGNPHESLANHSHQIMDTSYVYEHKKQENVIWHRGCFVPGTRVFTEKGYEPIEEIQVGDKVLDQKGALQIVTETFVRHIDEEIYEIRVPGAPKILATKEHPWLVAEGTHCKERGKDTLSYPRTYSNSCDCCFDNKDYHSFEWRESAELNSLSVMTMPNLAYDPNVKLVGPEIITSYNQHCSKTRNQEFNPNFCYLIGLWLAEGHVESSCGDNNLDRVGFSFNKNETETLIKDVQDIVNKDLEHSAWLKSTSENCINVFTSIKGFGNWLVENFGRGALRKTIPYKYLIGLNDDCIKAILKGLFCGDGSLKHRIELTVASPHLASGAYLLLNRLGYRPTFSHISLETLNNSNNGFVHNSPMFRISVISSEQDLFKQEILNQDVDNKKIPKHSFMSWHKDGCRKSGIYSIKKIPYKGPVFNIEVENSHSYLLPGCTSHNCRNLFVGGGGPNLGQRNPRWIQLRQICHELGINSWHEFDKYLLKGNIDPRIKQWMISVHDLDGFDGASEHREVYKLYFRIYHPSEEPEELKEKHIA